MTFSQRVVSITQDVILPKVIDNVLNDNIATYRFIGTGKKWSGETLKRPIKISKNSNGGSFSGMDVHSVATVETRITMSYDLRAYEIPIAIPGMEKAVNSTDAQVLNLVKTEIESSEADSLDDIGTIFYADGTGNSNKDFIGMDAINDDGTSVTSIGNQSRTTYPLLKGTRTASSGVISTAKIATLTSAVAGGSALRQRPTIFLSDETTFDLGEQLLTPTQRANYDTNGYPMVTRTSKGPISSAQNKGALGFVAITYRGIPWVADEKSTSQTLWELNENYIDWYGLQDPDLKSIALGSSENLDGVYSEAPSDNTGFQWTGFMRPINMYGEVGHIYLMGNMTTFQPRRHGRLTGITST